MTIKPTRMTPEDIEKRLKACEDKLAHYTSIINQYTLDDEQQLPENLPGVISSVEETITEIEDIISKIQ